jgi:hypothetical protein
MYFHSFKFIVFYDGIFTKERKFLSIFNSEFFILVKRAINVLEKL